MLSFEVSVVVRRAKPDSCSRTRRLSVCVRMCMCAHVPCTAGHLQLSRGESPAFVRDRACFFEVGAAMAPKAKSPAKSLRALAKAGTASPRQVTVGARGMRAAKTSKICTDKALRGLVDQWLDEHPECVMAVWAKISTGELSAETLQVGDGLSHDTFSSAIQTWEQIDKGWIAQLLSSLSSVSLTTFDQVDSCDGKALKKSVVSWCGINMKHQIPDALRVKRICWRFLELRYTELGSRGKTFAKEVTATGEIQWPKISPWKFEWAGDKVAFVKHAMCPKVVVALPRLWGLKGVGLIPRPSEQVQLGVADIVCMYRGLGWFPHGCSWGR